MINKIDFNAKNLTSNEHRGTVLLCCLSKLLEKGFLQEKKVGKAKIYFNEGLFWLVKDFGTN